ncbi:MAG: hypothetical protein ACTSWP_10545 [Candidatus Freyarchaeota archaeon]|nr:hypothetical protein [Candidatus Freyrarchaeum guaymaensis]
MAKNCLEREEVGRVVAEINEIIRWLREKADVDKALNSEGGPVECRRTAIAKTQQLMRDVNRVYMLAMDADAGIDVEKLEEAKSEALQKVKEYYDVLTSDELSSARALHISRSRLNDVIGALGRLVEAVSARSGTGNGFAASEDEDPLIRRILSIKERVRKLEEENRTLREEIERLKGGGFLMEPFDGGQRELIEELERLKEENKELRRQVEELRCGAESTAYQSLLEENNALRQRTNRLLEALRATRRRYEQHIQELMKERDEWRSKAIEKTVKSIEDTMFELRSQVESLKRENRELKERLGIAPPQKEREEKDEEEGYEFYFS